MSKKYKKLQKHVMDYTADELRGVLGGLKTSELLRSIILNEKEFIKIDYNRSLRRFWYATVKPSLDKLGLLTENDQTEEGLTKWDSELSRYTGELVKMGVLNYTDLRIVDESRRRETPESRYITTRAQTYGYKTNIAPYPNIIISTEKDTVYSIIEDIAQFFGCSCISGKGQNSLAAMEDLLRGMGGLDGSQDIYILTMTDYDPSGYYIADTFKHQAEDIKNNLNITGKIILKRVGIYPDQLTTQEIEQNKYTPKAANRDKWFMQTGGINGEPKGLELDAFPPHRIREIFVTTLKNYIDPDLYYAFVREAYIKRVILTALQPAIDNITDAITASEQGEVRIKYFDPFVLAMDGHSSLPIDELCYTDRDAHIIKKAISYIDIK